MRGDYITTYTKIHFSPLKPMPEHIKIEDIAHALSLMTRANGHFKRFYSVAQHSINCTYEARAMGCDAHIQLACLLHDASEAYIADIVRPVKQNLPAYREIENNLQRVIHETFGIELTANERDMVKRIDDAILYHEFIELMGERVYDQEPKLYSKPDFALRGFSAVEQHFLRLFTSLMGRADGFKCVGIDGTKCGWIAACVEAGVISIKMFSAINELCEEYSDVDSIIIDIPIGLPESAADVRPDKELRKQLKGKASSVFSTPCRQAIYAANKQDSKAINSKVLGKSLSEQSLAICSRIKEVDEFLHSKEEWKNRLVESHPEYVFMILNSGTPIYENKKTNEGLEARLSLLRQHTQNIDRLLDDMKREPFMKQRLDDIIDAICLAVIGNLGMTNKFLYIPENPTNDNMGLKMQIVYAEV